MTYQSIFYRNCGVFPPDPPLQLWFRSDRSASLIRVLHFTDNIGANYLCVNPVFHTRMKHLAIDYHFVRDLVAKKELQVSHVPSSHQLADLLTKSLSRTRHQFLASKIGAVEPSSILRGRKGAISSS
ncbi:copia protein [Trifolium medium]|uniref:Copia protein n=1 Tax=Trifolium medium TaxID=97028 RepID=A0A392PRF2_9FABA|nr:copia protein [Trifolium medium]